MLELNSGKEKDRNKTKSKQEVGLGLKEEGIYRRTRLPRLSGTKSTRIT
jgi:hypothetical protein